MTKFLQIFQKTLIAPIMLKSKKVTHIRIVNNIAYHVILNTHSMARSLFFHTQSLQYTTRCVPIHTFKVSPFIYD